MKSAPKGPDAHGRITNRAAGIVITVQRMGRTRGVRWYAGTGEPTRDGGPNVYDAMAVLPQPAGPAVTIASFDLRTQLGEAPAPGDVPTPPSRSQSDQCERLTTTWEALIRTAARHVRQVKG